MNEQKAVKFLTIIGMIIFFLVLWSLKGTAGEIKLLEIDSFSIQYRKHVNYRDEFFHDLETINNECTKSSECMKFGANALFDLTALRYKDYHLFWRNDVAMDATNRQVRHVSWDWEAGFNILPKNQVEVFHHHESRHMLDDSSSVKKFPLRDEYVVKFNFIKAN